MSLLGKRIIILAMAWVFLAMIVSQLYDNLTATNVPPRPRAGSTFSPAPTVTADPASSQLADLQRCVASDPNNLQCVVDLANLYYASNQWPQAQASYESAIKLSPHDASLLLKLAGTYIYQQQFDAAVTTLQQAASLQPASPEVHLLLGLALSKSNPPQVAQAIAEWRQVVSLAPGSSWAAQANQLIQGAGQ